MTKLLLFGNVSSKIGNASIKYNLAIKIILTFGSVFVSYAQAKSLSAGYNILFLPFFQFQFYTIIFCFYLMYIRL